MIEVHKFVTSVFGENCYIINKEGSLKCILVDPGSDFDKISTLISTLNLQVEAIFLTHAHIDHCNAVYGFKGIPVYMSKKEQKQVDYNNKNGSIFGQKPNEFDGILYISDNETVHIADMDIKAILTPGHTVGSMCYLVENYIFSGDTLFKDGFGRTDLYLGNYYDLVVSIKKKLLVLDGNYIVLPGHGKSTKIKNEQHVFDRDEE